MKKKILSLFLSIALLVAACSAMAACGGDETTDTTVTTDTTTEVSTTTTETEVTTTETHVTTTETTETTTNPPVVTTTTTEKVTTTTQETTTTTEKVTTPADTTTLKLNSVLDFGNDEVALKVLENATYDSTAIAVETEKDAIVVYAKKNYEKDVDSAATYSITFSLDGVDTLKSGFGTYEGRPWYVSTDAEWQGCHQYMALSFKAAETAKTTKYIDLTFTFSNKKTCTVTVDTTKYTANANGDIVVVLDLVYVTATNTFSADTMPKSTWGTTNREITAITANFFGTDVVTGSEKVDNAFKPTAGDSITINYIVFAADYNAVSNYGVVVD